MCAFRVESVRAHDIDKVEIYKCFRPGDVIRAEVVCPLHTSTHQPTNQPTNQPHFLSCCIALLLLRHRSSHYFNGFQNPNLILDFHNRPFLLSSRLTCALHFTHKIDLPGRCSILRALNCKERARCCLCSKYRRCLEF
jgi:hypothetical protein